MLVEKEEATFTLTQVETITGLKVETLRAWRKRGFMTPAERYSRIGLRELASLAVRKQLLNHGYSPGESQPIGDAYAPHVVYAALLDTAGSCEVHGTAEALKMFQDQWGDSNDPAHDLAETGGTTILALVSADGGPLTPGVQIEVDQDTLSGYYIQLLGIGRHLGAAAQQPLMKLRVRCTADEQGPVLVRRVPRMPRTPELPGDDDASP